MNWNDRYAVDEYIYGTEPNAFLAEHAHLLTGPVLSLAEGEGRNAVFLADVHGMPSLIGKWFAIPAMQKYTYRVVLDRDGRIAAQYPGAEDQVLWLQLQDNTVVSQHTFTSAEQLQKALQDTPAQ